MLSKTVAPKTKAELIRALQSASIRSFEIFELHQISNIPSPGEMKRIGATVIVLR